MARRIRNTTNDVLDVPLLGVRIEPGDVAEVPDELGDVVFPETHFEVDGPNDGGKSGEAAEVRQVFASDTVTADERAN